MHVFFINKYQTEFTKSIDKIYIYIDIFLKHRLLNFHGTFPYLYTGAEPELVSSEPAISPIVFGFS
jgi:hypothetical protein